MIFSQTRTGGACGAVIHGLDLSSPLSPEIVGELRQAWLAHQVLVFPEQNLTDDDLERFSFCFGSFAGDPCIPPMEGRNIIELRRRADETTKIFADAWQTREDFQYHHQWQEGMVVMWDNRSVLHKANGGYEGHERVLHRTVVA